MNLTKNNRGFTIIEVVLVLAIAGMIFLVVFLAVPQLQESRRDNQRRQDLSRIATQLESFAANNNGNYPANTGNANCDSGTNPFSTFVGTYLGGGNYVSPSGADYRFDCVSDAANLNAGSDWETVAYRRDALCNGELSSTAGANNRNFTLQIALEGGGVFCLDNS